MIRMVCQIWCVVTCQHISFVWLLYSPWWNDSIYLIQRLSLTHWNHGTWFLIKCMQCFFEATTEFFSKEKWYLRSISVCFHKVNEISFKKYLFGQRKINIFLKKDSSSRVQKYVKCSSNTLDIQIDISQNRSSKMCKYVRVEMYLTKFTLQSMENTIGHQKRNSWMVGRYTRTGLITVNNLQSATSIHRHTHQPTNIKAFKCA